MTIYCCVDKCGRSSRTHPGTIFYTLPPGNRKILWLRAANRDDLIKEQTGNLNLVRRSNTPKICERHFSPNDIVNKQLKSTAMPTLCLNGEENADQRHPGIKCNHCSSEVVGFRYKCMQCPDYDLCHQCECREVHPEHIVVRMPRPAPEKLTNTIKRTYNEALATAISLQKGTTSEDASSDDEPVVKYMSRPTDGVDLTEDEKETIRKEVARVLNIKPEPPKQKKEKRKLEAANVEIESDLKQFLILPKRKATDIEFADVTNAQESEVKNEREAVEIPISLDQHYVLSLESAL